MGALVQRFRREHALVRRACGCLATLADDVQGGEPLDMGAACDLLRFFELFVDGAHQRKEEEVLFLALLRTGRMTQRVGELLGEHGHERRGLARLRESLTLVASGAQQSAERFAEVAVAYALAQLEHAEEEDQLLLPLAEELLDDGVQADLDLHCAAIDRELELDSRGDLLRTVASIARDRGPCGRGAQAGEGFGFELPED